MFSAVSLACSPSQFFFFFDGFARVTSVALYLPSYVAPTHQEGCGSYRRCTQRHLYQALYETILRHTAAAAWGASHPESRSMGASLLQYAHLSCPRRSMQPALRARSRPRYSHPSPRPHGSKPRAPACPIMPTQRHLVLVSRGPQGSPPNFPGVGACRPRVDGPP